MYLMNGYLVFKVHEGAGNPLTPLLQHSRPESELIFLKNSKKIFGGQKHGTKNRARAKINSPLLTFERKRAIIIVNLEGGGFMPNTIPSGQLIKLLHDRLEKQANNTLRGKDLTMMQVAVLMELQEAEQMQRSMKELERKFCVAQSTVVGIISRLEQKGFVEAFGDASDKRIKLVHITPDGEVCCREAAGYMAEAEQMLLKGFSEDEKALFNQLLARAAENMK